MKVKNISGTSNASCNCDSWLAHWEKFSKRKVNYCGEASCQEKTDLVGAHVKRTDVSDSNTYILPLCKKHNKDAGEMTVFVHYDLVRDTCPKS